MTMPLDDITGEIIDAALKVHRAFGPGLLESAYEECLAHELRKRGMKANRQVELPIEYDGMRIDDAYRIDLLVENRVIAEVKAVTKFAPIHEAQLLSYLKLSDLRVGLLINFNVRWLKNGVKRMIN